MQMHFRVGLGLLVVALGSVSLARAEPPATPKRPVTDEFHGVKVTEDYRWLEDWNDPAVKKWSDEQNSHARSVLDNLPNVAAIRKRLTELRGAPTQDYSALVARQGQLFALKTQPPRQQPMVVVMKSPEDSAGERIVIDPNQMDPTGSTSIDFFVPSLDGKLVAVSLSEGGSESGTAYVFETATGKKLGDVVPRVNGGTAGGSVAWNGDGTGFFYTRYPRGTERGPEDTDFYQQVYFHKLGTPTEQDTYEIGKEFPRIAEVELDTSEDGRFVSARVENGDGEEFEHYLRSPEGKWTKVAGYEHKVNKTRFGHWEYLTLLSRAKAPRGRLLMVQLEGPSLASAERLVEPSEAVIEDVTRTREHVFVLDMLGGVSQVRLFDFRGLAAGIIPILPQSRVGQIVQIAEEDVLIRNESFLQPPGWYRVNSANVTPVRTRLSKETAVDFSGFEVARETATSKDGTKVPISIVRKKGIKLDGTNPTLLWGYGGYGLSQQPSFSEARMLWLEQGGVFAMAHIRGGGEFGEEWHRQGNLTKKQNVFDDFHASMLRMVELGYCTPDKLAIYGGSNGGLLMGAMLTQHPGDFRAVVSSVGIYDMLRVELSSNGAFNVTEFGTVKDKQQFNAMHAYSPYHRVQDGTSYPAILMMTGANDPRVDPMQSRKMTARLQAAGGKTVLLRTSANAGHGVGASLNERIEQDVDRFAFLFHQLGVAYKPVGK